MNKNLRRTYRHLLYVAMLDIRLLHQMRKPVLWNPKQIWAQHQRSQRAGALAHWLHNLAAASGRDFRGFQEDEFGDAYGRYQRDFPTGGMDYKQEFEDQLERLEQLRRQ